MAPKMSAKMQAMPFLSIPLALGSILGSGLWFHFTTNALQETKHIVSTLKMAMPPMFTKYAPGFLVATVIVGVLIPVIALLVRLWRSSQILSSRQSRCPCGYLAGQGTANTLLYILTVWLAIAFGVSILWFGAGLVTAKSTLDAANTLSDVDPAVQNLIRRASGGVVDPVKTGFLVSVGTPKRNVNIGQTTCGLFCFVLARAMMSETMDCTCNAPIMRDVNVLATDVYHKHMQPALICVLVALLCTLGLLMASVGGFSAAKAAARGRAPGSPGSSGSGISDEADAAVQFDQSTGRGLNKV